MAKEIFGIDESSLKEAMRSFDVLSAVSIGDAMRMDGSLQRRIADAARRDFEHQFEMEGVEGESVEPVKGPGVGKRTQSWRPLSRRYGEWKKTLPSPANRVLILTGKLKRAVHKCLIKVTKNHLEFEWRAKSPEGFPYSDVHQDFPGAKPLRRGMRRRSLVATKELAWQIRDIITDSVARNWERLW